MIIAAIYPVFIWFLVFRFRRTWVGLALATAGTLAILPIGRVVQMVGGSITGGVMAKLVYGEMSLIALVSVWLVTMRRPSKLPLCPYCCYDLTGLPAGGGVPGAMCPECGNVLRPVPRGPKDPYCLACGHDLLGLDPDVSGHTCPICGAGEEEFGNWKRAQAVRDRALAERLAVGRVQGRSAR